MLEAPILDVPSFPADAFGKLVRQDPLPGDTRTFLEDGDTLTLRGAARGDGYTIGFGDCTGTLLPALEDPYKR